MRVALRHAGTDDLKLIGTGWSWSLFLGAGFLGLPLFFRGLAAWGTVMLVLWVAQLALPFTASGSTGSLELLVNLVTFGLCLYLGFRGNALAARHLAACGYELAEPDSPHARYAAESWGI